MRNCFKQDKMLSETRSLENFIEIYTGLQNLKKMGKTQHILELVREM